MFIHGEGASCHPCMWMAKVPTGDDGTQSLTGMEMGRNDFCNPQGRLGSLVLQQETVINTELFRASGEGK